MDLAHAIAAGGLAARTTDRRFATDEIEVAEARARALARRASASAEATQNVVYRDRGRHAAPPRPAQA